MQRGAADSAAGVCGKGGLDGDGVARGSRIADEAYAAQNRAFGWSEIMLRIETEGSERFK